MSDVLNALSARINNNLQHLTASQQQQPPNQIPDEIRLALLDDCYEVQRLCSQPSDYLERLQMFNQQLSCLQWLCHFNVFAHIPMTGAISFPDLAAAANVPLPELRRVARMAMLERVLCEPVADRVAYGNASFATCFGGETSPSLRPWAQFLTGIAAPTAMSMAEATQRSKDPSQGDLRNPTAYNVAFDTPLPLFQHLTESPGGADMFAGYMRSLDVAGGTAQHHLLKAFAWASLGDAHIVDVGGSNGHTCQLLSAHFPQLRFTVQDLPEVIAQAQASINNNNNNNNLTPSIHFTAHDFLTPQPPTIAHIGDIYLLRRILHNWPDHQATQILQHLADAMATRIARDKETQSMETTPPRLLIMDTVLPAGPHEIPAYQEGLLRMRDLVMWQSFHSQERGWADWMTLLQSTRPPLRVLCPVAKPAGSHMSVLVVGI
ncbi:S-adenosyl-L-methionine-dependent methyltransferase [Aspergillus homomorphus CBS 101889]|uniref:S-adenosyl-L-methionine-dependent methyltransferase n=1 Tax=Aspergillus homomorphus (strain CBS 101889) TaxID=1450537 RepID=A0A395I9J7_ASPHC|nr:S-adenosyl-L-methionine-dependent methyltransferase [Aspergillus homomorphus CBS 101889]RAL16635.1 S-adenosyl-L-methionine-dependent methyltransferase [Aspergillus homomorphus CBS 101889]